MPTDLFGVCVVGTSGKVYAVGNADYEFTIMSVSKPFVFALVCQELGVEDARQKIGVNATGMAFNSLAGIERNPDGRTNPMVNSGAIATTSLVPGATFESKWKFIHEGLSRFAGRTLPHNDEVYVSASETNSRNQSIARLLQSYGRIYTEPAQAVDLYTKQCALNVSAKDLAVMGATLAVWRRKSDHQGAGNRRRRLPLRVGGHDDCRLIRDVWRLAFRHWSSRQKRHWRRNRHRLSGKGTRGDSLPRCSTTRATASRDNSWPNSFLSS